MLLLFWSFLGISTESEQITRNKFIFCRMSNRTFHWIFIPILFVAHLSFEALVVYHTANQLPEYSPIYLLILITFCLDLQKLGFPPTLTKPNFSPKHSKTIWILIITTFYCSNSPVSYCKPPQKPPFWSLININLVCKHGVFQEPSCLIYWVVHYSD